MAGGPELPGFVFSIKATNAMQNIKPLIHWAVKLTDDLILKLYLIFKDLILLLIPLKSGAESGGILYTFLDKTRSTPNYAPYLARWGQRSVVSREPGG